MAWQQLPSLLGCLLFLNIFYFIRHHHWLCSKSCCNPTITVLWWCCHRLACWHCCRWLIVVFKKSWDTITQLDSTSCGKAAIIVPWWWHHCYLTCICLLGLLPLVDCCLLTWFLEHPSLAVRQEVLQSSTIVPLMPLLLPLLNLRDLLAPVTTGWLLFSYS